MPGEQTTDPILPTPDQPNGREPELSGARPCCHDGCGCESHVEVVVSDGVHWSVTSAEGTVEGFVPIPAPRIRKPRRRTRTMKFGAGPQW